MDELTNYLIPTVIALLLLGMLTTLNWMLIYAGISLIPIFF